MARAPEAEYVEADQVMFALESLELTGEDRLEVSGRWFGVRGRRFVRPTLTLLGAEARPRWLADLEHKPWSAEDGETWTAAFDVQLDGRAASELELAVAPDIAVTIPGPDRPRKRRRNGAGNTPAASTRDGEAVMAARPASAAGGPQPAARRRELDALRKRLDEQRRHVAELRGELERAGVTKAEMTSALTRRDAAVRKLDALVRERDEAIESRDEAIRARDEALRRREQTVGAIDEAVARRELAIHEAEEARRERDGALRERHSMVRALERMRTERDQAVARRKEALSKLDQVQKSANAQLAQLRERVVQLEQNAERERELAARLRTTMERAREPVDSEEAGPVFAGVDAEPLHPRVTTVGQDVRVPAARHRSQSPAFVWARRALAVLVLIAAIIAILVIVHSP
jgi:hypothetical protein